jgi:RNA 2',3'-cyclic 3'-phosphodiesterase
VTGHNPIRAFVAISLPPGMAEKVAQIQQQLDERVGMKLIRWNTADQLHLTLRFLGTVPSDQLTQLEQSLPRSARGIVPFTISLSSLGTFPSAKRPRVIWIGLSGQLEILRKLQAQVDAETGQFGTHSEEREFKPHLTIGRVRDPRQTLAGFAQAAENLKAPVFDPWPVGEFHLFQSKLSPKGATHTIVQTIRL